MNRKSTEALVIHTSATRPNTRITVDILRSWHKQRGFSDIGYHYFIDRDGKCHRGRSPETSVGSHVKGWNDRTLGICLEGGLNPRTAKPENNYTRQQFTSLQTLLIELMRRYPTALILGHRDLSPDKDKDGTVEEFEWLKACPCFDAGAWAKSRGLPGGRLLRGKLVKL